MVHWWMAEPSVLAANKKVEKTIIFKYFQNPNVQIAM